MSSISLNRLQSNPTNGGTENGDEIECRETLLSYFKTGKIPTEDQFAELINTSLHQACDGIWRTFPRIDDKIPDDPLRIQACGNTAADPQPILQLYNGFNINNPVWEIQLDTPTIGDATSRTPGLNFVSLDNNAQASSRLFIDHATGNIGIGMTNPSSALEVNGRIEAQGISGVADINNAIFIDPGSGNVGVGRANFSEKLVVDGRINTPGISGLADINNSIFIDGGSGNVGIGQAPNANNVLSLNGRISTRGIDDIQDIDQIIYFDDINNRIGINQNTPSVSLEVNSTIKTTRLLVDTIQVENIEADEITAEKIVTDGLLVDRLLEMARLYPETSQYWTGWGEIFEIFSLDSEIFLAVAVPNRILLFKKIGDIFSKVDEHTKSNIGFGASMVFNPNNNELYVGAPEASASGAVSGRVFVYSINPNSGEMTELGNIRNPDFDSSIGINAKFGASLYIYDYNALLIGAPESTISGIKVGQVYVFDYSQGSAVGAPKVHELTLYSNSVFNNIKFGTHMESNDNDGLYIFASDYRILNDDSQILGWGLGNIFYFGLFKSSTGVWAHQYAGDFLDEAYSYQDTLPEWRIEFDNWLLNHDNNNQVINFGGSLGFDEGGVYLSIEILDDMGVGLVDGRVYQFDTGEPRLFFQSADDFGVSGLHGDKRGRLFVGMQSSNISQVVEFTDLYSVNPTENQIMLAPTTSSPLFGYKIKGLYLSEKERFLVIGSPDQNENSYISVYSTNVIDAFLFGLQNS